MRSFFLSLLVVSPLLPLLAGLLAGQRAPASAVRLTGAGALGAFIGAIGLACGLVAYGPAQIGWTPEAAPWLALGLRLDPLSVTMALLVTFLGVRVGRFASTYLSGDPRQARFHAWMSLTLGSVLAVVLANTFAVLLVAWISTSLCLHRLLLHYPERAGAVFSARKKFVVSRLGDLCLLVAGVVLYRHYGTTDFDLLFAAAAAGDTAPLPAAGLLLAGCAALKSAQFPFHSWLPDTMETPTPVSAFMHAGIVNAGGFLVLRLSPLFIHAPEALALLAVLGALTAAFGAIVMLAQPSVKRALAYSTVAQMGFMLLQCGLGAFGLALLHLLAHSLYKAHAFLHAGSTIGAVPRAAVPLRTSALIAGTLAAGALVVGGAAFLQAVAPAAAAGSAAVFATVLAFALAYGLARIWSAGGSKATSAGGVAVIIGIAAASLLLHGAVSVWFDFLPTATAPSGLVVGTAALFAILFVFQALLWRTGRSPYGRALYVHALNGFYVGTWANRMLNVLWPRNLHA
jgi:NAD(P)H-quinone oxidoreductase subunit 5